MGRDVNAPLRKAYIDAIRGMSYGGSALKAYDKMVPDSVVKGEEYLYCVVADQTVNDSTRTKNVMAYDATIQINIVHGTMGSVSTKKVDDIASMLHSAFLPTSGTNFLDLSANSLDIVTTTLVTDATNVFSTEGYKMVVRSIRYRHQISE
jgi:hypothetical protein